MNMTQMTSGTSPSGAPHCPNCYAVLPPRAAFCAYCGERLVKKNVTALLQNDTDISTRYRITSLVRRRPYVSLFFAIDHQRLIPVAIRDIDISSLGNEAQSSAWEILQKEYDLLRRESIPSIMPVINLRHFHGHLYVVSSWPSPKDAVQGVANTRLQTLQDVLQSGIGLPGTHRSLFWIEQLCSSLDKLHRQQIVLGDLDPQALILGSSNYDSDLLLLVSWMPPHLRSLLPRTPVVNNLSNFSAPEVLLGKPDPRSDIYSLGAVLYLLLTGVPPEEPMARIHRSLPSPGEVNTRINARLDEFVMKALAIESSGRFQSAREMAEALSRLLTSGKRAGSRISSVLPPITEQNVEGSQAEKVTSKERRIEEIANTATVIITPLPETDLAAWKATNKKTDRLASAEDQTLQVVNRVVEQASAVESIQRVEDVTALGSVEVANNENGSLVALPTKNTTSILQRLQHLVLGEQKHSTMAAAIIETPLRVQPNQPFSIRIQLMGRDMPVRVNLQGGFSRSDSTKRPPPGLSTLTEGELVFIEIRSTLSQNFAYIVQQATVHIPADGFSAEITIPLQPLSNGTGGRRERLHIFFMDKMRRPLYEKPFIVELFISHLVQPGREGHNALTIPI
jgi:serine/threonine protein kinase